jgi:hypothetical protein
MITRQTSFRTLGGGKPISSIVSIGKFPIKAKVWGSEVVLSLRLPGAIKSPGPQRNNNKNESTHILSDY